MDLNIILTALILSFILFMFYKSQIECKKSMDYLNRSIRNRSLETFQSEHQFKRFFNELSIPSCIFNVYTLKFVKVNKKFCNTLGYTEEEFINMEIADYVVEDDISDSIDVISKNIEGCDEREHINRYIKKSQEIVEINWIYGQPDIVGNVFCIAIILNDTELIYNKK